MIRIQGTKVCMKFPDSCSLEKKLNILWGDSKRCSLEGAKRHLRINLSVDAVVDTAVVVFIDVVQVGEMLMMLVCLILISDPDSRICLEMGKILWNRQPNIDR